MATTREKIVTNAKIGNIEFVAASVSGGGARRLVQYNAIGVDGAELEDLGEDARTEVLAARLDEIVYQKLENLRREAKIVKCVHPLFGVFDGRIASVKYNADTKSLVNSTITLIEDGKHTIQLAPVTVTLGQAQKTFDDDLDGLADFDFSNTDTTGNFDDAFSDFSGAGDDFSGLVDTALSGNTSWQELGIGFDVLGEYADTLIDVVDDGADFLGDMAGSITDTVWDVMASARSCVNAAQNAIASTWEPFTVIEDLSVAELCREFLGNDDDASIQKFLASNPNIIDLNAVTVGTDLLIPVEL